MKLSYEDKVQIYELRQNGNSLNSLSKQFGIAQSGIKYMIRLIERYGTLSRKRLVLSHSDSRWEKQHEAKFGTTSYRNLRRILYLEVNPPTK